ncbi:MAG: glycosyltransferase family 4 protein [Nitrospirae bacterium]|nr:glycosyltransferase family 4 protein [Nitrospirota bacterium]
MLAISDIFALSSLSEGMPVSIMEAMASGLPVVSTDVGGVSELVMDGETGFLVPPKNPDALAEKIKALMDDKALREKMGMNGQERINETFTLERMVAKTEELYKSLVL